MYFGSYIAENFRAVQEGLYLNHDDIHKLLKTLFRLRFLLPEEKRELLNKLDNYLVSQSE